MKRSLIHNTYNKNKVIWHTKRQLEGKVVYELSHIYGRTGIFLCCPHFWDVGERQHHDNWQKIKKLREEFREDYMKLEVNFVRKCGCLDKIFDECTWCQMVKLWKENKE